MSVSYDYYRIFYYVAKYGSFTRAASILMNSQPNITRTIANLEKELDCRLFLRTNRGVTLTPEGKKLFAHVEIAHEQLQNGELELASEKIFRPEVFPSASVKRPFRQSCCPCCSDSAGAIPVSASASPTIPPHRRSHL